LVIRISFVFNAYQLILHTICVYVKSLEFVASCPRRFFKKDHLISELRKNHPSFGLWSKKWNNHGMLGWKTTG